MKTISKSEKNVTGKHYLHIMGEECYHVFYC